MATDQLDDIINDGKVNSRTAMIIFAIELKQQRESIAGLNEKFDGKVATKQDKKELVDALARTDKRVDRLEGFLIKILVGAASILVTGVVGASIIFK